jgi:hypothetical protein
VGKAPLPELAHNFVNSLTRIEAFLDEHDPPYIAKVYRVPAAVSLWYPK